MKLLTLHDQLLIVLDDESIERIRKQDPAEVNCIQVFGQGARPSVVGVTYLNTEDQATLVELTRAGKVREAFSLATRGFKFQPEKGDHDSGPTSLL